MNAFLILQDNRIKQMPKPSNPDGTFSLEQVQQAVGGYIERVLLTDRIDGEWEIWVDEEGRLKDKGRNDLASWIAGRGLVGDVLVATKDFMQATTVKHPNIAWAKQRVIDAHPGISETELATLHWDGVMRCYVVKWAGMQLGIETSGEIHS